MNKAIYIGAGQDLRPIIALQHIQHFICVDTMPVGFFGKINIRSYMGTTTSWLEELLDFFESIGFTWKDAEWMDLPRIVLQNTKTGQTVHYYFATAFPSMIYPELEEEMRGASTLISIGHHPHKKVLEYLTPMFDLVVYSSTHYGTSVAEKEDQPSWIAEPNVEQRIQYIYEIHAPDTLDCDYVNDEPYTSSILSVKLSDLEVYMKHKPNIN